MWSASVALTSIILKIADFTLLTVTVKANNYFKLLLGSNICFVNDQQKFEIFQKLITKMPSHHILDYTAGFCPLATKFLCNFGVGERGRYEAIKMIHYTECSVTKAATCISAFFT